MNMKLTSWIAAAVVAAGLIGWMVGATGRSDREQARVVAEQRTEMTVVRALILEGRVSLYQSNFGDASQKFEAAHSALEGIQAQLRETGQAERAGALQIAIAHVRDAQRLAASFDAAAHTPADEALKAIGLP